RVSRDLAGAVSLDVQREFINDAEDRRTSIGMTLRQHGCGEAIEVDLAGAVIRHQAVTAPDLAVGDMDDTGPLIEGRLVPRRVGAILQHGRRLPGIPPQTIRTISAKK